MDVKTLCLGALSRGEASGYEIRKMFEEGPFAHFCDASFGSIYPALSKLTEEGLATVTATPQDKRPGKKVYRLTPRGRMALIDTLGDEPMRDGVRSDFLFTLFFAHLLTPQQIQELIERRVEQLRQRVERMESVGAANTRQPGERFVCGLGIAVYGAMKTYLEDHGHELVGDVLLSEKKAAQR
jgi:DNA-binding PadR family transcriptional regulator